MNGLRKYIVTHFFMGGHSVPVLSQFFSVWKVKGSEGFPHRAALRPPEGMRQYRHSHGKDANTIRTL